MADFIPSLRRWSPTHWVVAAAPVASLMLLVYGVGRYTSSTTSPGQHLAFGLLAGSLVVGAGIVGVVVSGTNSGPDARTNGFRLGVTLAVIWTIAILVMHLAIPNSMKGGALGVAIAVAAMGATAVLCLIAGLRRAWRARSLPAGVLAGLFAGLISGLFSFACVLALIYGFMDYLLQYPKELHDFGQSGEHDLRTWFFWEELSGATGYLLLEVALATTAAAIGSSIGRFLVPSQPGELAAQVGRRHSTK